MLTESAAVMCKWRAIRYLLALVAMTAVCAPYSGTNAPAGERHGLFHEETYPQVFDCSDSTMQNLYRSTAFRMRHSRFFVELADSMRRLQRGLADTGGKKYAVLSFRIDKTGKVDSLDVKCSDSSSCSMKDRLQARILSWRFVFSPSQRLLVIQDISIAQVYSRSFFERHRIPVIIGLIGLGVLLAF